MRPDGIESAAAPDARGTEAMTAEAADAIGPADEPDAAGGGPPDRADPVRDGDTAEAAPARLDAILDAEPEGEGLDLLARAATEDASPSHRAAAIAALGDSADPSALDALIAATDDLDPSVVIAAIEELRWSDDRLARDAILRLVDSPDAAVAAAAQAASEDFESPRSPAR
jgi:HEAT repeat protein